MTNIDEIMANAEAANFDMLGAVAATYKYADGTTTEIKILLDEISTRKEFDGTGEIEIAETDGTIMKNTANFGIAAPAIGEKITIGSDIWLITGKTGETSFDTKVSLKCDKPKNKQHESRFKRLK